MTAQVKPVADACERLINRVTRESPPTMAVFWAFGNPTRITGI